MLEQEVALIELESTLIGLAKSWLHSWFLPQPDAEGGLS